MPVPGTSSVCETSLLTLMSHEKSSSRHGPRSATSHPNRFPPPGYLKVYISVSPADRWTTAFSPQSCKLSADCQGSAAGEVGAKLSSAGRGSHWARAGITTCM